MKLWLSEVDPREKVDGVKAIRAVGSLPSRSHEAVQFSTLDGALRVWEQVKRGEHVLLVVTDDADVMKEATAILDQGSLRYQLTSDEEMPKSIGGGEEEMPVHQLAADLEEAVDEDEYVPTVVATQCAAVLLAQSNGVPFEALSTARSISRLTGHDFWEDVAEFIIRTFPAPPQIQQQLLELRQS